MPGRPRTVHPRWRGEHLDSDRPGRADAGSSPLARGTHLCFIVEMVGNRFIPAGAGNTTTTRRTTMRDPVHPRWRGEHDGGPARRVAADGSSPLARGTPEQHQAVVIDHRFIPAGAGNTPALQHPLLRAAVHPRWRGEHARAARRKRRGRGSSPLARGTLFHQWHKSPRNRFIPAGAGNTWWLRLWSRPLAVHPRWRGEHVSQSQFSVSRHGSSPLARGTLPFLPDRKAERRFIPAGAGNTC